jgi:hypothetical protein
MDIHGTWLLILYLYQLWLLVEVAVVDITVGVVAVAVYKSKKLLLHLVKLTALLLAAVVLLVQRLTQGLALEHLQYLVI